MGPAQGPESGPPSPTGSGLLEQGYTHNQDMQSVRQTYHANPHSNVKCVCVCTPKHAHYGTMAYAHGLQTYPIDL